MKVRDVVLGTLCVGLFCTATVFAGKQGGKENRKPDKNRAAAHFKEMDQDGDGSLSQAEFTKMHEQRRARMKKRMGDRWNPERAARMPSAEEIFTKMDKDESGGVTQQEMTRARKRMHERCGKAKGKGKRQGGGGKGTCNRAEGDDVSI